MPLGKIGVNAILAILSVKAAKGATAVPETNITPKIQKQMIKRGWNAQDVNDTIDQPFTTRQAFNRATGNQATAYFNKDGTYVVKDDVTGDVVQISNRNDPNWAPDQTIKDSYRP